MAHIWFMHDAHLGCALFFLDMLVEYTLLSTTVRFTPCLWYVVGMNLVCPMSKFPQAPFARAPSGESRITCERFARIASNLRFAIFYPPPPKRDSQKRGSVREPQNDSRESGDSRESANRFARIGPSKVLYWINSSLRFELVFSSSGGRLGAYAICIQATSKHLRRRLVGVGVGVGRNIVSLTLARLRLTAPKGHHR